MIASLRNSVVRPPNRWADSWRDAKNRPASRIASACWAPQTWVWRRRGTRWTSTVGRRRAESILWKRAKHSRRRYRRSPAVPPDTSGRTGAGGRTQSKARPTVGQYAQDPRATRDRLKAGLSHNWPTTRYVDKTRSSFFGKIVKLASCSEYHACFAGRCRRRLTFCFLACSICGHARKGPSNMSSPCILCVAITG